MQRVVIDTNVLVSALIQHNYPYFIVQDLILENRIEVCISQNLFGEYYEVLNRKKFAKYPDFVSNAQIILADIEKRATMFHPKIKLTIINDKDDNMLLELADESKADFLITGNTKDFTIKHYKKTIILSPKNYWNSYQPRA